MSAGMTRKELAALAGYTYRRLYDIDRTMPPDKKLFVPVSGEEAGKAQRCDAALFVQRWVDYCVEQAEGAARDLDRVRAEHEQVKKRKTELEVERMEGTMVPVDEVRRNWCDMMHGVMQGMMALPGKLAGRLVEMESAEAIGGIIEQEVRTVLETLSEQGIKSAEAGEAAEEETEGISE